MRGILRQVILDRLNEFKTGFCGYLLPLLQQSQPFSKFIQELLYFPSFLLILIQSKLQGRPSGIVQIFTTAVNFP